jgi:hypothetical protein
MHRGLAVGPVLRLIPVYFGFEVILRFSSMPCQLI